MPKSKPITTGIFYRPPNQANFMELIVKSFYLLNLKDNQIYLLGDFNINLLQNGNYILNRKGNYILNRKGYLSGSSTYLDKEISRILSNIFFKAINNLSYMCNMQHLLSN